ncbi:MAG: hypothetical protein ABIL09_04760 [Gemmatimonadota bacterium]
MSTRSLGLLPSPAASLAGALMAVVALGTVATGAGALSFEVVAGQSFYTEERTGHLILLADPDTLARLGAVAQVLRGDEVLVAGVYPDYGRRVTVPVPLARLPQGESPVTCRLVAGGVEVARATVSVTRLPQRPNAVKIDRVSGGLIVDGLPFFPVGFYCYSPVQPGLAEEEVVRGFNVMSPYQTIAARTLSERRAYMDRCAAVGLKVHYQLLSVAGGGGVGGGRADETGEQEAQLRAEVEAFRDHPALLAWYLSDEPTGHNASPAALARAYEVVRQADPYHPVTIVFMAPRRAGEYAAAFDLAMTDPPHPRQPPGLGGRGGAGPHRGLRAPQARLDRAPGLRRQRVVDPRAHGRRGARHDLAGHRRGGHRGPVLHPPWAEPLPQVASPLGRLLPRRPGGNRPGAGPPVARSAARRARLLAHGARRGLAPPGRGDRSGRQPGEPPAGGGALGGGRRRGQRRQ